MEQNISRKEKKLLLEIARNAIVSHYENSVIPAREETEPLLQEKRGCFVCIKINGKLRGCIGSFVSDQPLYQLVREMAVSAATRDPRFYPMSKQELGESNLEISILTSLQKVSAIDEIVPGKHGLYIEKNTARGVLLPQVASEYGWDRETFLCQTSIKAGMQADAWKEGAGIYIFGAEVFNEE
jgi:uncharacterized protein